MDLAAGAKQLFVIMDLFTKSGKFKLVEECTYPLTGVKCERHTSSLPHPRTARRHIARGATTPYGDHSVALAAGFPVCGLMTLPPPSSASPSSVLTGHRLPAVVVHRLCGGLARAFAMMAGIYHRRRTGRGCSAHTMLTAASALELITCVVEDSRRAGADARDESAVGSGIYRTQDGWLCLAGELDRLARFPAAPATP